MTTKRMLIDASHPEETRVVVINGKKLEDFDVEVESKKQLKGNIYLAKVTRVEPSLQAAFVNYGGNRHGFLAFSEIHPDYYQIPVADKEALLANEQMNLIPANEEEQSNEEETLETLGGDVSEEVRLRQPRPQQKNYKIQEVVKRNQVLLIQVVKEERGTKGAALSTYLSLAGRYCVLMPNTARGGGISRKINNITDRKRLKAIVGDLGIPSSMAVIIRTAGSKRSKAEIKRDYEYTTRLWSNVRALTLESIAPALVHEEGNLIKRSIRDLYDKELNEVIVSGEYGYRMAKDFMKLLIPSHSKKVQPYSDTNIPIMQRYQVEAQLDAIHSPEVYLKSGGYIVINPTEALVSIDVNSGKATKERNIEETALKTNLEAATEIAFQLKLRDLSGLIVIDFIDMESIRNQQKIERQIKDAMRIDRARIQIGRISPFGLLELSRQRLRPSLIETSSEPCPHCNGSGIVRSIESTAVHILRVIEEECLQRESESQTIFVPTSVALYLFNQKRPVLAEIEDRYKTSIYIKNDDTLIPPEHRLASEATEENTTANIGKAKTIANKDTSKKRRRRRNRRSSSQESWTNENVQEDVTPQENTSLKSRDSDPSNSNPEIEAAPAPKRRRRGRRGGRRKINKPGESLSFMDSETQNKSESNVSSLETDNTTDLQEDILEMQAKDPLKAPIIEKKKRVHKRKNPGPTVVNIDAPIPVTLNGNDEDNGNDEEKVAQPRSHKNKPKLKKNKSSDQKPEEKPKRRMRKSRKLNATTEKPSTLENQKTAKIGGAIPETGKTIKEPSSNQTPATGGNSKSRRKTPKKAHKTTIINIETTEEGDTPIRSGWWQR